MCAVRVYVCRRTCVVLVGMSTICVIVEVVVVSPSVCGNISASVLTLCDCVLRMVGLH